MTFSRTLSLAQRAAALTALVLLARAGGAQTLAHNTAVAASLTGPGLPSVTTTEKPTAAGNLAVTERDTSRAATTPAAPALPALLAALGVPRAGRVATQGSGRTRRAS